jgi:hypothetical protein
MPPSAADRPIAPETIGFSPSITSPSRTAVPRGHALLLIAYRLVRRRARWRPDAALSRERLRKRHAALPADEKKSAPLEEFEGDEGERLRPLGADRGTCVIDEHEVAIG